MCAFAGERPRRLTRPAESYAALGGFDLLQLSKGHGSGGATSVLGDIARVYG